MNNSYIGYKNRLKRKRFKKLLIKIFIGVLIVIIGIRVIAVFPKKKELVSPQSSVQNYPLGRVVEKVLHGSNGSFAVAVKNLNTGENYYFNEHKSYQAGSLYKLWVLAVVYQQIQNGEITKDEILKRDIADLNKIFNIDPEYAEFTEGQIKLSIKDALYQMITISHNYAALMLAEKIKLSTVKDFLSHFGFHESAVSSRGDPPILSAFDIAVYLEKLYKKELANDQFTEEMIEILKNQKLKNGIPKYLPENTVVASKTGDIGWFKHDAGIVYTVKGDYIIVVLSESTNPVKAQETIALVSQAVFEYFNKI